MVLLLVYYTWTFIQEMSVMVVVLNLELIKWLAKFQSNFLVRTKKSHQKSVISAMLWDLDITYLLQRGFHRGGNCSNEFNLESEKKKDRRVALFLRAVACRWLVIYNIHQGKRN